MLDIKQKTHHIYIQKHIIQQFEMLDKVADLTCYAVKANFNSQIIETIVKLGGGFDCVSIGEIKHVLSLGADCNKILFSGVGKTEQELEFAIEKQIKQISCESEEEVLEVIDIANKLQKKANMALRTNLDIKTNTHKYISTGGKLDKFGIDSDKIIALCQKIYHNKYINFVGLTIHIGSQILDITNFKNAFIEFEKLINNVQKQGYKLQSISLGGGLGVAYKPEDDEKCKKMTEQYLLLVEQFRQKIDLPIVLEPGRFLVANACTTIAQVVRVKKTENAIFLILNVGMNNIIRPALYQAYHHIEPVIKMDYLPKIKYKIVGPVCESADVFHDEYLLQEMKRGDFVEIFSTGAYCRSMASSYNLMPIIEEIFIAE